MCLGTVPSARGQNRKRRGRRPQPATTARSWAGVCGVVGGFGCGHPKEAQAGTEGKTARRGRGVGSRGERRGLGGGGDRRDQHETDRRPKRPGERAGPRPAKGGQGGAPETGSTSEQPRSAAPKTPRPAGRGHGATKRPAAGASSHNVRRVRGRGDRTGRARKNLAGKSPAPRDNRTVSRRRGAATEDKFGGSIGRRRRNVQTGCPCCGSATSAPQRGLSHEGWCRRERERGRGRNSPGCLGTRVADAPARSGANDGAGGRCKLEIQKSPRGWVCRSGTA